MGWCTATINGNALAFKRIIRQVLKRSKVVKSVALHHYANVHKQKQLWELYPVDKNKQGASIRDRWHSFRAGTVSHLKGLGLKMNGAVQHA